MLFNVHEHTLSVCLDFDGCTDSPEARQALIDHLVRLLKNHPHVTQLELSLGSTRGYAFINDFHTTHAHHLEAKKQGWHKAYESCAILKTEFLPALQARLNQENLSPVTVQFDELTIADIFNNQKRGVNFRMMQKFHSKYAEWGNGQATFGLKDPNTGLVVLEISPKPQPLAIGDLDPIRYHHGNALTCSDENKLLMLQMQLQDKAVQVRAKDLTKGFILNFFDDRSDITKEAWHFYRDNPHLIPRNGRLRIDPLNIKHGILPFDDATADRYTIQGTGLVNPDFEEDIRAVAQILRTTQLPSFDQTQAVVAAFKELRQYALPDENDLVIRSFPEEACAVISQYFPQESTRKEVEAAQEAIVQAFFSEEKQRALDLIAQRTIAEATRRESTESFAVLKEAILSVHAQRFAPSKPPAPPLGSPVTVLDSSGAANEAKAAAEAEAVSQLGHALANPPALPIDSATTLLKSPAGVNPAKEAIGLATTIIPFSTQSTLKL